MANGMGEAGKRSHAHSALAAELTRPRPTLDDPSTVRDFVEKIAEAIYISTPEGRILDGNPALLRIFGAATLDELRERGAEELFVDPRRREEEKRLVEVQGSVRNFEFEIRRLDGTTRTVSDTVYAHRDDEGETVAYHGILVDITERKQLERKLEELSVRDPLTGAYNRRYLERIRPGLERPTSCWGCLILDLDNFKAVNDTYGHEEGDRVLQGVAHFVRRHGRAEDVLVRLGGDEFAMIVQASSEEELESIADRLLDVAPYESPAAFSLGVAFRHPGEKVDQVVARADRAMYAAKGRGLQPPESRRRDA